MLTIKHLRYVKPDQPSGDGNVHGFYANTVKKLYGIDINLAAPRRPTRNHSLLSDLIASVLEDNTDMLKRFYDIRLEEELGSAAPQYEILETLNLPKLLPFCIKGMGMLSVSEGLELAEAQLGTYEAAIFSVSRLRSACWQSAGEEFAIAFIAVKEEQNEGDILIKRQPK